jgi:AcrR family transcriptional regulator
MARTYKTHSIRKAEILETARKLFFKKGYEKTSVDDIIGAAQVSKGGFYHHFSSKEELVDCLVTDIIEKMRMEISVIFEDNTLSAIEKLKKTSNAGKVIKTANRDILKAYLIVVYRDENIVLRHKINKKSIEMFTPLYSSMISQGIREGVFNTQSPDFTAKLMLHLSIGFQDMNWKLFLDMDKNPENISFVYDQILLYENVIERLLGAKQGILNLVSENDIREFTGGKK